jgi:hypothetical protein
MKKRMAKKYEPRKRIGFTMLIIVGLLLGFAIKRVALGLVLGIVLGLLASGMIGGKKDN